MKRNDGFMRGINLGGWLSQCKYEDAHYEEFIKEEDIKKIAEWGADHVRLPIDYPVVTNTDGSYREQGFSYITNCISWCRKYDLRLVLDLHKTEGYIFDDFKNSKDFFYNEILQLKFLALWNELTRRYGKEEDMLAFELLNEVVDPDVVNEWNTLATKAIRMIRNQCPTIKIIVGGVDYNSVDALKLLELPEDENIVYNFHCYEPFVFTHQKAYWVEEMPKDLDVAYPLQGKDYFNVIPERECPSIAEAYMDRVIDASFFEELFGEAIKVAEEKGVCLYCGEYGVIDQAEVEHANVWYQDIYSALEKLGIGSATWTYKGLDFGLIDRPKMQIPFLTVIK